MGKFIDLTGQRFGKLIVTYRDEDIVCNNGIRRVMWHCHCDCGNETSVRRDALISGKTKSCGKCNNDLTGRRFGRLTVLHRVEVDHFGHVVWKCHCDCGNDVNIMGTNLIQHYTMSCGCLHSEIISGLGEDLIGQKFGKLTVIKLVNISPRKYLCSCECGGKTIVKPGNLKNGHTQSCGCIVSLGQEKINVYLTQHNINFTSEYSTIIDGMNGLARYDFAIFNDNYKIICLIEYHGVQHYQVAYTWNDNEEALIDRQHKDELKRQWAINHHVPLYEIPYWEFDNIEIILKTIIQDIEKTQKTEQNDE